MKPKPFSALKNFTVPVANFLSFVCTGTVRMTRPRSTSRVVDRLLALTREVLGEEIRVVRIERGLLFLDGRVIILDAQFACFAPLALLRGLFHPRAFALLLGEGGALLLTAHGHPLWPTEPGITHHGAMPKRALELTTSDDLSLEAEIALAEAPGRATAVLCHP